MSQPRAGHRAYSCGRLLPRWLVPSIIALLSTFVHADERQLEERLTMEQQYSLASEALALGDFDEAVDRLRVSAGAGHVGSMEALGVILLHGPAMFGSRATSNACEARRWLRSAQVAGSALGATYGSLMARSRIAGMAPECRN